MILTFMWPYIIMYHFKYNQQDATLYNILYYCQYSTTLAVAASNLDIYPMLRVQFLSSWWWAEKPP